MKRFFSWIALALSVSALAQAPANYYNGTAGLTGAALKTKLSTIISTGAIQGTYNGLWSAYATTDRDYFYENDGTILDIYSENPTGSDPYTFTYGSANQCGTYVNEGDCYNREHIVPQSLFSSSQPMYSDIHFIRPTDGKVNGLRSNYPFGMVGTLSNTSGNPTMNGSKLGTSISPGYSGIVFEPIDQFKGDVARMVFYFVTRYENRLSEFSSGNMLGDSAYPGLQPWFLQQLLIWNMQDPPSAEEQARNNATYAIQNNRNPFIDNYLWANEIWGTPDSVPPTAPTNLLSLGATSSTVTLSWTAATDNIAVMAYDIYVDNVYKMTTGANTTTATVTGLNPTTTYSFYVIAKDGANNQSPQSNVIQETTLDAPTSGSCGTENFNSITNSSSSYSTIQWTNNGISWTATDARGDQNINGKAITLRNGNLSHTGTISGGIGSLTLTTKQAFGSTPGVLNVYVGPSNNPANLVGTIPYGTTNVVTTTTIPNINRTGAVSITIVNPNVDNARVAIDDLTWTCYTGLATDEVNANDAALSLVTNPVRFGELEVKGKNLNQIKVAQIFSADGKLVQQGEKPLNAGSKIQVKGIPNGVYLLKLDQVVLKFIKE